MMISRRTVGILILIPFIFSLSLLFGQDENGIHPIRFNHADHVLELELDCEDCHSIMQNLEGQMGVIPDHENCSNCHEVEDENKCGTCHLDPNNPVGIPSRSEYYRCFVFKDHENRRCDECHREITTKTVHPEIPHMTDCQKCHENLEGPLDCAECHGDDIPLRADHKLASWIEDHGLEASVGTADCASCHSQTVCDECHQGNNIYGSPHLPTWKFDHFTSASFGEDCLSCHEDRESCTACHRAMIPLNHPLGPLWANKTTGGDHTMEAGAFIEACLACHDLGAEDPSCVKCHD